MRSQPINEQPSDDPAARTPAPSQISQETPSNGKAARPRFVFWVCVILSIHLQLSLFAIPPSSIFSGRPFASADFQTHYAQTTTLSEGLDRFGKHWVYDPDMLAGAPGRPHLRRRQQGPFPLHLRPHQARRSPPHCLQPLRGAQLRPPSVFPSLRRPSSRPAASWPTLRSGARPLDLAFRLDRPLLLVRRNDLLGHRGPSDPAGLGALLPHAHGAQQPLLLSPPGPASALPPDPRLDVRHPRRTDDRPLSLAPGTAGSQRSPARLGPGHGRRCSQPLLARPGPAPFLSLLPVGIRGPDRSDVHPLRFPGDDGQTRCHRRRHSLHALAVRRPGGGSAGAGVLEKNEGRTVFLRCAQLGMALRSDLFRRAHSRAA